MDDLERRQTGRLENALGKLSKDRDLQDRSGLRDCKLFWRRLWQGRLLVRHVECGLQLWGRVIVIQGRSEL